MKCVDKSILNGLHFYAEDSDPEIAALGGPMSTRTSRTRVLITAGATLCGIALQATGCGEIAPEQGAHVDQLIAQMV